MQTSHACFCDFNGAVGRAGRSRQKQSCGVKQIDGESKREQKTKRETDRWTEKEGEEEREQRA